MKKRYFKTQYDLGGIYWESYISPEEIQETEGKGLIIKLRLAGNPTFLLKELKIMAKEKYGDTAEAAKKGASMFAVLLQALKRLADKGYSPFVVYLKTTKTNKTTNNTTNKTTNKTTNNTTNKTTNKTTK